MDDRDLAEPGHCERRGYHGPFTNLEKYDSEPGWQGLGECVLCGSTRHVRTEESRRREVLDRDRESRGGAVRE